MFIFIFFFFFFFLLAIKNCGYSRYSISTISSSRKEEEEEIPMTSTAKTSATSMVTMMIWWWSRNVSCKVLYDHFVEVCWKFCDMINCSISFPIKTFPFTLSGSRFLLFWYWTYKFDIEVCFFVTHFCMRVSDVLAWKCFCTFLDADCSYAFYVVHAVDIL